MNKIKFAAAAIATAAVSATVGLGPIAASITGVG